MTPDFEHPLIREHRGEIRREVDTLRLADRIRTNGKPRSVPGRSVRAILPRGNGKEVEPEKA